MNRHIPDLMNLARTLPGVIYRVDIRNQIPVFVSNGIRETAGYQADEILSGSIKWGDLVIQEDRPVFYKYRINDPPAAEFSIEYRIRHKTGQIRWILERAITVWEDAEPRWRDGIILDISSAKTHALELASKKNDFTNLINSLDDIVFELDASGRFKNYYARACDGFILSPEVFINKTISEVFSEKREYTALFENAYQRTIADNGMEKIEYAWNHNGTTKWFQSRFVKIPLTGTVSITVRDITKRKNAELALKKREKELDLAIRGADLGIWNWYLPTGEITCNEQCVTMLGYARNEIHPHVSAWEDLIHPHDKAYVMESLHAYLNGETPAYECEYRLRHKNEGKWVWVLNRSETVEQDNKGRTVRMSGTFLDISARKKAELGNVDLRFKLEEFKAAINEATIVSIADLRGNIKYANKKFIQISQYDLSELFGKKHSIINSGHHPRSFWKEMWQTIKKGNVWRGEVKNKRKDGTCYWVDTFIIPLRDTANEIFEFLSIRNDITEKKLNEIQLQDALKKAEESDRLKSAFLANISHEIRTPMTAIMGLSELLIAGRTNLSSRKRTEFSRLIYERSQSLLNVVNNILDISKIEAGQVCSFPVEGNIREMFDRLLLTFKGETSHIRRKNIDINVLNRLAFSQNHVVADFLRLYQVFNNLLTNAAKFTGEGSIEFGCWLSKPDQLTFWVSDTGMGIPADKLGTIFLPFRQADETIHQRFGGSGLGLAISKAFVELWGGRIWVESELGKGSSFYFTMPYVPANVLENNMADATADSETF